jgi:hypothetical protein
MTVTICPVNGPTHRLDAGLNGDLIADRSGHFRLDNRSGAGDGGGRTLPVDPRRGPRPKWCCLAGAGGRDLAPPLSAGSSPPPLMNAAAPKMRERNRHADGLAQRRHGEAPQAGRESNDARTLVRERSRGPERFGHRQAEAAPRRRRTGRATTACHLDRRARTQVAGTSCGSMRRTPSRRRGRGARQAAHRRSAPERPS